MNELPHNIYEAAKLLRERASALQDCKAAVKRLREALRDLHGDIQGRIDDGGKFNPGTLSALASARTALAATQSMEE